MASGAAGQELDTLHGRIEVFIEWRATSGPAQPAASGRWGASHSGAVSGCSWISLIMKWRKLHLSALWGKLSGQLSRLGALEPCQSRGLSGTEKSPSPRPISRRAALLVTPRHPAFWPTPPPAHRPRATCANQPASTSLASTRITDKKRRHSHESQCRLR